MMMISKRNILALSAALALVAICLAVAVGAQSRQEHGKEGQGNSTQQLEGTWIVTLSVGGVGTFSTLDSFVGGGVVTVTNNIQLTPPASTTGQGVWEKVRDHQFAYTFTSFNFDPAGNPAGTSTVRGLITLTGKDTYSGVEQVDFKDVSGNVTFTSCGTVEARRMEVEPVTSCPTPTGTR